MARIPSDRLSDLKQSLERTLMRAKAIGDPFLIASVQQSVAQVDELIGRNARSQLGAADLIAITALAERAVKFIRWLKRVFGGRQLS